MKTEELKAKIRANRTENGGWTREFLESIGVPWPPPPGWKRKIEHGLTEQERQDFAAAIRSKLKSARTEQIATRAKLLVAKKRRLRKQQPVRWPTIQPSDSLWLTYVIEGIEAATMSELKRAVTAVQEAIAIRKREPAWKHPEPPNTKTTAAIANIKRLIADRYPKHQLDLDHELAMRLEREP